MECVRQDNQGVRRGTGPFGGKVTTRPVVSYTLIAINVLAYLVELANTNPVINAGAMVGRFNAVQGVADGQWWRLFTSAFLHEPLNGGPGILHIAFNMWALYVVGPALEQMLGRSRFLTVYLVSALGGSVLFYLVARPHAVAFGASGAIFGLFGAWFVVSRRLHLDARMIVGLIVVNLVISFTIPNIAWQAHVGGLVTGAALTAAYVYAPRTNRTLIQVAATVALVALLVVGVIVRDLQLAHQVIFTL